MPHLPRPAEPGPAGRSRARRRSTRLWLRAFEDRVLPAGDLLSSGLFQLDGDALTTLPSSPPAAHDFDQVYAPGTYGSSGGQSPVFLADGLAPNNGGTGGLLDATGYTGGQTKDTTDLNSWLWGSGINQQAKNDIEDAYAVAYVNPFDGHLLLDFGLDRASNNGDAFVGFWFFQNAVGLNPNGTFNGVHANGDILLQANVSSTAATIQVSQWVNGALQPIPGLGSDTAFLTTNAADTPAPWPFRFGNGTPPPVSPTFPTNTFFEGGLDVTAALNATTCVSFLSFAAETRSSSSFSSTLSDFALGAFSVSNCPDVTVSVAPDQATVPPGQQAGYTVTLSNIGQAPTTGTALSAPLPNLGGGNLWAIDPTSPNAGLFTITGPAGSQVLTYTGPGTVNPAAAFTVHVVGTVDPSQTGQTLTTTATVSATNEDVPQQGNNQSSASIQVQSPADLQVTKTDNSGTYTPGTTVTYTVAVTNAGPVGVTGATVSDTLPPQVSGATWTVAYAGGGSGPAGGSGNISATVDLPAGATATFTVTATVASSAAGNLVNTATVSPPAGLTDPNPANNSATDTDTPAPVADLAITKTDNSGTYTPGTTVAYTITVTNNGPSDVTGATVSDTLPPQLLNPTWTVSYSGGATGPGGGSGNINATVSLPAGAAATFTVTATASPAASGNLVNTATVTPPGGTTDPNPSDDTATDTDTPAPVADLSVTKDDGQTTAVPGTGVTYTITVTNNGPSDVAGARVTDAFPAALTGVAWTAAFTPGSSGNTAGAGNISELVNLLAGGRVTYTVTGTIDPAARGTLANTATVAPPPGTTDPTSGNDSATDTDTLTPQADLRVSKDDGSATYTPGTAVTYTVTVRNAGPSSVTGVTVSDPLPAQAGSGSWTASYAGGASGPLSGAGGINAPVDLPVGSSVTLTFTVAVLPTASGNLVNTATATPPGGVTDPNPADNSATDTDTPAPQADLQIAKTDNSGTYTPGTAVTYTIAVTNAGPSAVAGAHVTDTLPAALLNPTWSVAYAGGGSGPLSGTGNIDALVNLPVGATATFTVNVTASPAATGNLTNTAAVAPPPGTADPTPGNNSATDTDAPSPVADVRVSKDDGSATYTPGTAVTYTVVASNAGPSDTAATLTDLFPAQVTGATWTAAYAGGASGPANGTGNINAALILPAGGSATFTVTVTTSSAATGSLVNTATLTPPAGVTDPNPGDNTATDTDAPAPQADLQITKTDGSATAVPGAGVTYTIVVANAGPSDVLGAAVADAFPAAFTGAAWTVAYAGGGSGPASGSGDINAAVNLPSGATATFTVTAAVSPSATGTLANTATVTPPAGTTDPTPGNNSATDTDQLTPTADVSVTKDDGLTAAVPGAAVTYTIVVRNAGPSTAAGVAVSDLFPASLTGVTWTSTAAGGATGNTASGAGAIADTVTLPPGASVTYTVSATVSPSATGSLSNTATAAVPPGTTDPTPGNNSATDTDSLNPTADLRVTKTDGSATAVPGTALTYTIVVTNAGPGDVTGAAVADAIPAALTGVTWTATAAGGATGFTAAGSGNAINDTVSMPVGSTITYTVTGTVSPSATGALTNTATVTPPPGVTDPNPGDNSATDADTLTPVADLAVTKTDGSATYTPGGSLTYTITATNGGPSDVAGATVFDALPPQLTGASWTASYAGGGSGPASGTGDVAAVVNLPRGATATFTVAAQVRSDATGPLVNAAGVTLPAGVTDPNPGDNTATDTDTPTPAADLQLTKTDGTATARPGDVLTYTLTLRNAGPSDATGVVLTDAIPGLTSFSSASDGGTFAGGVVTWAVGTLPAGATITRTVTVTVDPTVPAGATAVTNAAAVRSDVPDPDPGDDTATDTDSLVAAPDLVVTKSDGVTAARPGDTLTYTVTVTNAGTRGATGVVLTDALPLFTSFVSAPVGGTFANGVGTWAVGDLPAGASATFTVTALVGATIPGDVTSLVNTATASDDGANGPDANPADNTAADTDSLLPTGVVSGAVFVDRNNDGVRDPGEPGIPGVVIVLTGTDDAGNPVNLTATTGRDGSYTFPDLPAGTYRLTEVQPGGLLDGRDAAGSASPAGNDAVTFTLTNGQSVTGTGFGELVPSSLTGLVYADLNGNGVADPADGGIGGVAVTLVGTDDLGNPVTLTTATAADGTYYFGDLRPGVYRVVRGPLPTGFGPGSNAVGTSGGQLGDPAAIADVPLNQDTGATRYEFGLHPPGPSKQLLLASTPPMLALSGLTPPLQGLSLPSTMPAMALAFPFLAAAPGAGSAPVVRVTDPAGGQERFSFVPFDRSFRGGLRLATADLNGDGVPDLVVAAGPGGGPHVRVFDGRTGNQLDGPLGSFFAFEPGFTGGTAVAAGDVNGDGFADLIVGAGAGGGPRVRAFSGKDGSELADFFALDPGFVGGVNVAAGDVNGDGLADVVVGAGAGGGPRVQAFSGKDGSVLADFFALDPGRTGGVSVAAADLDGDGRADIIAGAGPGGTPEVRALSSRDGSVVADFVAFAPDFAGGVGVAAADLNGDGRPDILASAASGGGPAVRGFDPRTGRDLGEFFAADPSFVTAGVTVQGHP